MALTLDQRNAGALVPGMWVETDQGVGIYSKDRFKNPDGTERFELWVHLVNADGTTLAQLPADRCSGLRIARKASVPAGRIAHLSDEALAALGYV